MAAIVFGVAVLSGIGCSDKTTPATILDLTPPRAIGDLTAVDTSDSSVTIEWSAPSEDGDTGGPAAIYDVRYRPETIDVGVWSIADTARGEPAPAQPGVSQRFEITGLLPDTLYAIGIVSIDDADLPSVLSNIAFGRTRAVPVPPDTLRPAAIVDLTALDVGSATVRLGWTATGDDSLIGRAAAYDLRYRAGSLGEETWAGATQVTGEPAPAPPGSSETFVVRGLRAETDYSFAILVRDDAGNPSALSNVESVTTPVRPPDFLDPRGIEVLTTGGGDQLIFVADHGDDVLYRFTSGGERFRTVTVPGLSGVARGAGEGLYYFLIAGDEGEDTGTVWRFGGSTAQPIMLYDGIGFPSDIAVYSGGSFNGDLLVGERSMGRLLRLKPGSPQGMSVLTTVTDGELTGVAVDAAGVAYFGVRTAAGSVIRKIAGGGDPVPFHDLGAMGIVGDLRLDPHGTSIWYIDLSRSAAVRVNLSNARVDTLATRLRRPVSIAPGRADSLLTYSSADGYVLTVDRRR
jgi:hypothetical protein